ncbi:MAG: KpsF/GutQ family sugar-phosphate isomerase [Chlamydiota bacterium]
MLKTLFDNQQRYLNHFFDTIDLAVVEKVFHLLLGCKGVIILSGVGKSGHIAQKISTTLLSTGTRSFYLSPASALHGDIGFVSSDDVFLALSKSGQSQELIDLLPHVQKKGALTIAVVSRAHSKMGAIFDFSIVLPVERELCPYDLAPTTSSAAQLIFGDCLAIALMQAKNFSVGDFAANHPAGLLGRKITLKVADLMLKGGEIPVCRPSDLLIGVLHELSVKRCGCLLVVDQNQHLLGIFTDGDLRRALMTTPAKTISSSEELAFKAMQKMEEDPSQPITVMPVLQGKQVIGLLRMHDILQAGMQ